MANAVGNYCGSLTKQVLDHFWHAHFFKMADISDGPISKLKLRKLLFLVTLFQDISVVAPVIARVKFVSNLLFCSSGMIKTQLNTGYWHTDFGPLSIYN